MLKDTDLAGKNISSKYEIDVFFPTRNEMSKSIDKQHSFTYQVEFRVRSQNPSSRFATQIIQQLRKQFIKNPIQ